jgi:hypothetical protein
MITQETFVEFMFYINRALAYGPSLANWASPKTPSGAICVSPSLCPAIHPGPSVPPSWSLSASTWAGTWIVGSAENVAARIKEFYAQGTEAFILSGWPLIPEAQRIAKLLFPLLELDHGFEVPVFNEHQHQDVLNFVPEHEWSDAELVD